MRLLVQKVALFKRSMILRILQLRHKAARQYRRRYPQWKLALVMGFKLTHEAT